jgi:hypothetical protein
MQNVNRNVLPARVSRKSPQPRFQRSRIANPATVVNPPGVDLLAPTAALQLPSLAGVPTSYSHRTESQALYALCRALVTEGVGDGELWQTAKADPYSFAAASITKWITQFGSDTVAEHIGYDLLIADRIDIYGGDSILDEGELFLAVECNCSGYLQIGWMLAALESEAAGLANAFYRTLMVSLYRWICTWDHSNAERVIEFERECTQEEAEYAVQTGAADTVEQALSQFELRSDEVLPSYIAPLDSKFSLPKALALLSAHKRGRNGRWISQLLQIHEAARGKRHRDVTVDFRNAYDDGPLPCAVIVMQQNDGIEATFDDSSQHFYEVEHEPVLSVRVDPRNPRQMKHALAALRTFVQVNYELSILIRDVNQHLEKETRERTPRPR